jgi:hypothetical protein
MWDVALLRLARIILRRDSRAEADENAPRHQNDSFQLLRSDCAGRIRCGGRILVGRLIVGVALHAAGEGKKEQTQHG